MGKYRHFFSLFITSVCTASSLWGFTVVVPGSLTNTDGLDANALPFNLGAPGLSQTEMRYQQVYDAAQFTGLDGATTIFGMAFRPDGVVGNAFDEILSSVTIKLSTTSNGPDGLSPTFADNVGADETTVFSGDLQLSSNFTGPTNGPKDFDIIIAFQTPFVYNSSLGNLLVEIENPNDVATSQLDSVGTTDAISRVQSPSTTSTIGVPDTQGLVTQFIFTPIPEPETYMLMGLGLLMVGVYVKRRRSTVSAD